MKKLLTVITGLVAGSALYAMPVLNPAEPALLTDGVFLCDEGACWGLKLGYRGDFVYDARVRDSVGHINDFQFFSNSVVVTLNLWDRLDLYGFVGPSTYDFEAIRNTSGGAARYVIGNSQLQTLWGIGAKAVLWETCWGNCGTTYIGLDAQYESVSNNQLDRVTSDGATVATNGVGFAFRETQVALGLAHRICNLVPYVAVKWANRSGSINGVGVVGSLVGGGTGVPLGGFRNHGHWGWAFGATLVDANRMSVTAEARFIDERALSVGAEFRF